MGMKRVLILRSNPVEPDPRVEKEARALAEAGYQVRVLGWDRIGRSPRQERKDYGTLERIFIRAHFGKGLANLPALLRFQVALLKFLFQHRSEYDIIHACDLDTVVSAYVAGLLFHKKVVYDIFDFYAEMLRHTPNWIKRAVKHLDIWLMGKVDAVILADEARKEQIRGAKPKRLQIIYNSPDTLWECRESYSSPPLRIVYVGLLQVERGILQMLEVLHTHPEWELDLAGFGGDEERIRQEAEKLPNVRYHGRIPYEETLRLTCTAHVLFATYDPSIPNHRYSSANKLFEAMAFGKPIIVARGTGMDRLVESLGLGYVVEYGNVRELEATLRRIAGWTEEQRRAFAERAKAVFEQHFSWEKMKKRLLALYSEL
ncbi:MAG: glycosyltransferase family 4 protein [Thermus sp.]|uniref:glycosyltransferase family 4 protein n=1 Tax=Thermus sp. TaxID=275 RepID=UPI00351B371F